MPTIVNEDNKTLIQKYRSGDRCAFDLLIQNNMGLVKNTVKRFLNRGTDYDDLVQIGCIGLIKAINAFKPELGFEFSTYAFSMIAGELKRHFRDDGIIRVSRNIKKFGAVILNIKNDYVKSNGEEPTMTYLAGQCGITVEDVAFYLGAMSPTESSNTAEDENKTLEEKTGTDNIFEFIERYSLKQALSELSAEEQLIIYFRYNLSLTQNETAKRMGTNQVKISREEKKIIEKLRIKLL